MKKSALFVFNGDPMCFVHVLLNGLDLNARGEDVAVIIEGAATALIPKLEAGEMPIPIPKLWEKTKAAGIIRGVCKACANKMEALTAAETAGLPLMADMSGHPGMAAFREEGYTIITF
ncbi:MAG: cytoplasmic protein [Deltaproteobacteria bacterium]|nr:MAG: cytoplasmic protein [Deltaproteobacteria bacterium]